MAAAARRLPSIVGAALLLSLPACSAPFLAPSADFLQAPECAAPPAEPVSGKTARPPTAPAGQGDGPGLSLLPPDAGLGADAPEFWDRVAVDVELGRGDWRNYYTTAGLGQLALGLAAAAPLANTPGDRSVRNWYQERVKDDGLDGLASVVNYGGQFWFVVPLCMEVAALNGRAGEVYYADGGLYEWGNRSLRATAVGYPPVLALFGLLGGGRPGRDGSHWHPFRDVHGVSGHTFVGAVPFLTAAAMTEDPLYKVPLVLGSFLTGWSRIHDDRHYLSQVMLGWWLAYLAVRSVDQTQEDWASFTPTFTEDGAAAASRAVRLPKR